MAVSYIDYESFLSPAFSPSHFANELVLATNDPTDTSLDLSTPLSRVLFDVQEVDTHIDNLTTKSALPLLEYTQDYTQAGTRLLSKVEEQVTSLAESYRTLEQNVIVRHEAAEQVRLAADRLCQTVKLGRSVLRMLQGGRQLELLMDEVAASKLSSRSNVSHQNHFAMPAAARMILALQESSESEKDETQLRQVDVVTSIKNNTISNAERNLLSMCQQTVRDFAISGVIGNVTTNGTSTSSGQTTTYAQQQDMQARTASACETLYLLSPIKASSLSSGQESFEPSLLLSALHSYLQSALTSSQSSLARALATLPTLDRTLLDISARCQNIAALEALLDAVEIPEHPSFTQVRTEEQHHAESRQEHRVRTLLDSLLTSLDTPSLPSYFWRSLASGMSSRVREILTRGGVSARTLRSSKDRVAQAVRECVQRGSQNTVAPVVNGTASEHKISGKGSGTWEREAAVMVGSITGVLNSR